MPGRLIILKVQINHGRARTARTKQEKEILNKLCCFYCFRYMISDGKSVPSVYAKRVREVRVPL